MKALESYFRGIKRATAEGKMVWLLWLVNVLFASFLYFSFSDILNDVLSYRAAAQNFLKTFDMNIFFEIITHHREGIDTIISFAILLFFGYLLASLFLNGGILFTLVQSKKPDEKRRLGPLFFEGGGKFFGRFFKLLLYSLILWMGAIIIASIFHMILNPFTEGGTNEVLLFYLILIRVMIALFLAFLVKMIVDYARIKIVVEDSSNVFLSLFQAMGFVFRRWGKTLAIYYLFVLTGAAIFIIFWLVQKIVKTHALLPILLGFLIGQIFILSRGWLKVAFQAAQMDYFQSIRPASNIMESASFPAEKNEGNPAT
jgi:hypothetical protein